MGKRQNFIACPNTSIEEMFRKISLVEFQDLLPGRCGTIAEVYEKLVRPNEQTKDLVLDWWKCLKRYIQEEDCTYFIRKFEHKVRRGFYTRGRNGVGFAYCGNPFAEYFLTMAQAGFDPILSYDEFRDFLSPISSVHIGHGYRQEKSKGECPAHQAYGLGPRTKLNRRGWYLAHIFSVAGDDFEDWQKEVADNLFACGELKDWCNHGDLVCPYKDLGRNVTEEERRVLVARFLRFVNPMNYFLVPKKGGKGDRRLQKLYIGGEAYNDGIGECRLMTEYMRHIRRCQYGNVFLEFEKLALCVPPKDNIAALGSTKIDLQYWEKN